MSFSVDKFTFLIRCSDTTTVDRESREYSLYSAARSVGPSAACLGCRQSFKYTSRGADWALSGLLRYVEGELGITNTWLHGLWNVLDVNAGLLAL